MKKLFTQFLVGLAFFGFSSAAAQTQYAILSNFEKNTLQADHVDLVTPKIAVSRGEITAIQARQFKAVFSNQNPLLRSYSISPKASVSLLTFPNFASKNTTLENLRLMVSNSDDLPSEFESTPIFALSISNGTIMAVKQVNTRVMTGVYEQGVLISKQTVFNPLKLMLDFVNVYSTDREMRRVGQSMNDNPGGLMISNTNAALRSFNFAKDGRIRLLKSASEFMFVTPKDLEAGLNGKEFGWTFDWDTYFYAIISDVTNEVFELRQGYTP
jgi:hypothetical protein